MEDKTDQIISEIYEEISENPNLTSQELLLLKNSLAKRYKQSQVVKNPQILEKLESEGKMTPELRKALKIKHIRALSGISNIAIMTAPLPCPGKCIYCPGGPEFNSPKAYTGKEPAARRAEQNGFSSYRQVEARLRQFGLIGHSAEKNELIIQGGTINALPYNYQYNFIKGAYDAFNEKVSGTLEEAKTLNEKAKHRVIGLTIETRPDYCAEGQIKKLLEFGTTRIELGVQSLDDRIMVLSKRGHDVKAVVDGTKRCKDALLKICYHMMPGLFATPEQDVGYFKELFSNPDFKPDMLKIYPTLVMPGTELYSMWKKGEYKPYNAEEAAEVISEAKRHVPEYCRIMRVNRDIPTNLIADGVQKSNLREMVAKICKKKGIVCKCIRCREIGIKMLKQKIKVDYDAVELVRRNYDASDGKEIFLSFEDKTNDALMGFIRLRINSPDSFMPEMDAKTAGIRELHVYGLQMPIGKKLPDKFDPIQHEGYGTQLLAEAEKIAKEEYGMEKMLIISGVGVREYYKKKGYALEGVYMSKKI
ncbi:MAG: tRNA uridine(34) 5-carboxymethylaminomethyl modification radical SAM/GNAT enzyme Elp3 [Candidatus Micrarchaeota archaeon]